MAKRVAVVTAHWVQNQQGYHYLRITNCNFFLELRRTKYQEKSVGRDHLPLLHHHSANPNHTLIPDFDLRHISHIPTSNHSLRGVLRLVKRQKRERGTTYISAYMHVCKSKSMHAIVQCVCKRGRLTERQCEWGTVCACVRGGVWVCVWGGGASVCVWVDAHVCVRMSFLREIDSSHVQSWSTSSFFASAFFRLYLGRDNPNCLPPPPPPPSLSHSWGTDLLAVNCDMDADRNAAGAGKTCILLPLRLQQYKTGYNSTTHTLLQCNLQAATVQNRIQQYNAYTATVQPSGCNSNTQRLQSQSKKITLRLQQYNPWLKLHQYNM